MKLHLSSQQMLNLWRLLRGYENPLNSGSSISRFDSPDLNSLLLNEIDAWYSHLLDTAPPEFLVVTDIASSISLQKENDGSLTVALPEGVRRILKITLSGWDRPAIPVPATDEILNLQENPFSRASSASPAAIIFPDNSLRLYSIQSSSRPHVIEAAAITLPKDGFFDFDSRAISLIPKFNFQL